VHDDVQAGRTGAWRVDYIPSAEPDRCPARPGGQGRRQRFRPGHGCLVRRRRHRCHRSRPVPCEGRLSNRWKSREDAMAAGRLLRVEVRHPSVDGLQ